MTNTDTGLTAGPDGRYTENSSLRHRVTAVRTVKNGLVVAGVAYRPGASHDRVGFQAELRHRDGGRRYLLPASRCASPGVTDGAREVAEAGFEVLLDPAQIADGGPLAKGVWELWLTRIAADGEKGTVRIGDVRDAEVPREPRLHEIETTAKPAKGAKKTPLTVCSYFDPEDGGFCLDVGGTAHPAAGLARRVGARWASASEPTLRLEVTDAPGDAVVFEAAGPDGERRRGETPVRDGKAEASFRPDLPGEWTFFLRTGDGVEIPVPAQSGLGAVQWRQGVQKRYAKPEGKRKNLVITVGRVDVLKGIRRRIGG